MKKIIIFLLFSISAFAFLTPTGSGSSGGISSINGSTVSSQTIAGANNISVSSSAGTTTVDGASLSPLAGSSSIVTVGTVATGQWRATPVSTVYGGTGLATLTANNVLLGNGAASPTFVAPSTSGNVLTSNGTTWVSSAAAAGGANVALSNLSGVAVNTALLPATDNITDFGSSSFRWHNLLAGNGFTIGNLTYAATVSGNLEQVAAASGTSLNIIAGKSTGGNGGDLNLRAARGNNAVPTVNDGLIKFIEADGSAYMWVDPNNGKLVLNAPGLVGSGQRGIQFILNNAGSHTASIVPDSDSLEFVAFSGFEFLAGGGVGTVNITSTGSVDVATIGQGLNVAEGTNARQGVATLSGGTVVVSTTKVAANSRIFLTCQDPNGGTPGFEYVSARTAATSFTITSIATDTCIVAWEIINPG